VPVSAARIGGVNPMGLRPGDQISLRDALYSALLGSDNVAAQTLANHVGLALLQARDEPGDTVAEFVGEMNRLAAALGMTRTKFANPHGLEGPEEEGYSTAADMAKMCIHAMRKPGFAFFVKQKTRKIAFLRGGERRAFTVENTNKLLGREHINGIKTGLTKAAGECLAVSSEKKPAVEKLPGEGSSLLTPRRLICVVLDSPDRFGRTLALVQEGWELYDDWMARGAPVTDPLREVLQVPRLR